MSVLHLKKKIKHTSTISLYLNLETKFCFRICRDGKWTWILLSYEKKSGFWLCTLQAMVV